jgi:hypothetical protein
VKVGHCQSPNAVPPDSKISRAGNKNEQSENGAFRS